MFAIFLSLMVGVYLHSFFPFSLLLLPLLFLPMKFFRILLIAFVIGTIIFFPAVNVAGYHEIVGKVVSVNAKTITVSSNSVDGIKCKEKIILAFRDRIYKTHLYYGDQVYFRGNFKKISDAAYYAKISTKDMGFIPNNSFFAKMRAFYLRKFANLRNKDIVASLLLGYKGFNGTIDELLKDSGFSPIFAISGLHIGLIAAIIYFVLNFLGNLWRKIVTVLFLIIYIFLIGFPLSATRAVTMLSLLMILSLLDLPSEPIDVIGIVGMIFIFIDPFNAYNPGFLMSFFGAAALILAPNKNFLPLLYLFLFIFPLTSWFFSKIFLPSFLFQSFVVVPLVTVFMIVGIIFLFFPVYLLLPALDRISDIIYLSMKFAYKMPVINYKISLINLWIYYVILFGLIFYFRYKKGNEHVLW